VCCYETEMGEGTFVLLGSLIGLSSGLLMSQSATYGCFFPLSSSWRAGERGHGLIALIVTSPAWTGFVYRHVRQLVLGRVIFYPAPLNKSPGIQFLPQDTQLFLGRQLGRAQAGGGFQIPPVFTLASSTSCPGVVQLTPSHRCHPAQDTDVRHHCHCPWPRSGGFALAAPTQVASRSTEIALFRERRFWCGVRT